VLGIPVDATPSEINACKRNLLRLNHPDLVATRGQEAVNNATLKCQRINQAYELLKANGKC
jgi:DnaJ-class molecular chaperone